MWIPGKVARAISSTIITLVLKSPASREKHETSSRMKQEKRGFEAHPRTHRAVRELTAARRRKNRKWKRKKKNVVGSSVPRLLRREKLSMLQKARVCHIPCSRRHLGFADHIHYGAYQGSIRASLIVNLDG